MLTNLIQELAIFIPVLLKVIIVGGEEEKGGRKKEEKKHPWHINRDIAPPHISDINSFTLMLGDV